MPKHRASRLGCCLLGVLIGTQAAAAARPKQLGRLTAMALPGGPIAGLVGGGADPDRVWAFNDAATFWRSDDAGDHWIRLADYSPTPRLLVPSPHDRHVLYAVDLNNSAVYRSRDAGLTFTRIDDGSLAGPGWVVSAFATDPFDPATLYAGASGGFWISHDGGVRWQHTTDDTGFPLRIVADPAVPGTIWARGLQDPTEPLWRSRDGGVSWSALSTPFEAVTTDFRRAARTLLVDAARPGRLLLAGRVPGSAAYQEDSVFETLDAGATWRDLGAPLAGHDVDTLALEAGPDGALWARIRWEASHPSRLFRRAGAGAGWVEVNSPDHQQIDDLFATPTPDTPILVATRNGIRRYVDGHWQHPRREPAGGQPVTAIAAAGVEPSWVFVGTENVGLWRGLVSGEPWQRIDPVRDGEPAWVTALAVSASTYPAVVYVAVTCVGSADCFDGVAAGQGSSGRIFRSDCGGCSWQPADAGLPPELRDVTDLAIDPTDVETVWATVRWGPADNRTGGVWRSRDGGHSWQVEWRGLDSGSGVFGVEVAPDDPDRVFANAYYRTTYCWQPGDTSWQRCFERSFGILSAFAAGPNGLTLAAVRGEGSFLLGEAFERSLDGGTSWDPVVAEPVGYLSAIHAIATTRDAPGDVWIANTSYSELIRAGLWRSRDRGEHFELAVEKDGITSLTTFPDDRGVVFLGTGTGLYRWIDACAPDADTLCLDGGRMRVEGSWQNRYDGSAGHVRVRQQSDATGVLAFSDLANPELIVKTIDLGRPRPEIFVGQLTDLDWAVRITDTKTGERRVITNHDDVCQPATAETAPIAPGPCVAGADTLCMLNGRLRVRATWDNQYDGSHGVAGTLPYSPLASWLTFVDPTLPELLLKALDFGDRTLLYWGALTDLGYQLTIDDLRTGVSRSYTNAPGQRCGGSDTWPAP